MSDESAMMLPLGPVVNTRLVRASQPEQTLTHRAVTAASGLFFWQIWLFGLWQFYSSSCLGNNPLCGEGWCRPRSQDRSNSLLPQCLAGDITSCTAHTAKSRREGGIPHARVGACWPGCHDNPVLQLSSVHQLPQQHHKVESRQLFQT